LAGSAAAGCLDLELDDSGRSESSADDENTVSGSCPVVTDDAS
jgi:hypothetical protein